MNKRFGFSRRSKWLAVLVAGLLVLGVVGVALAANVTVDSFDVGTQSLSVDADTQSDDSVRDGTSALGDERDATLEWLSGDQAFLRIDANIGGGVTSNRAALTNGDGTTSQATIVWDGNDNSATTLSFGLNANLASASPANDALRVRVPFNDSSVGIRLRAYTTDSSRYSEVSLTSPGGINTGEAVDFILLFDDFTDVGGGVDWSDVDAIELFLDSTLNEASDFSIDQFDTVSGYREYGDLPNTYGNAITTTYHSRPTALRLGGIVDAEVDSTPDVGAAGDDAVSGLDVDDEDGVVPTSGVKWNTTTGGSVNITVKNCTNCYVSGWVDFDDNGNFVAGEQILNDSPITTNGTWVKTFTIASADFMAHPQVYARFRLCASTGQCNTVSGSAPNGEIEDYRWSFGPLAVTLESLQAKPVNTSPLLPLALVGGAAAILLGAVLFTRKSRKQSI